MLTFETKRVEAPESLDIVPHHCVWDGETPVVHPEFLCSSCRKGYEEAKASLYRFFAPFRTNEKQTIYEFGSKENFQEFCVLESAVRLSSPLDGLYYGSYKDIVDSVPYGEGVISKTFQRLIDKRKIRGVSSPATKKIFEVTDSGPDGRWNRKHQKSSIIFR